MTKTQIETLKAMVGHDVIYSALDGCGKFKIGEQTVRASTLTALENAKMIRGIGIGIHIRFRLTARGASAIGVAR